MMNNIKKVSEKIDGKLKNLQAEKETKIDNNIKDNHNVQIFNKGKDIHDDVKRMSQTKQRSNNSQKFTRGNELN